MDLMQGTLAYLQPNERAALDEFKCRLEELTEQLIDLALFGSKSRGDFDPDSDLDVLIVLEQCDWQTRDRIHLMGARVSLDYDVLLNTHPLDQEQWEDIVYHQATLWREVQRDGVSLLPEQATNT
jgi:predicted nucleotidyltransferase